MAASSGGFSVPFARSVHGALVDPAEARKGVAYLCPACGHRVDLHAGDEKRRHFHHRPGSSCSSESVQHLTAKVLIVDAVTRWIDGRGQSAGVAPSVVRECSLEGCDVRVEQPLPKKVRRVASEVRLGSGHVIDVGLFGPGEIVLAAIEVRHTHDVDAEKGRELAVPWIEVAASEVCETRGRVLSPLRDRFLPFFCPDHRTLRRGHAKAQRDAPLRRNAVVAALGFRLDDFPGFALERIVVCPNGHDAALFSWQGAVPPWPRPPLVVARQREHDVLFNGVENKLRRSLPFRRQYGSICGACGAPLEE